MDGRGRDYPEREQAGEGTGEVQRHRRAATPPDKKTFSDLFEVVGVISGLSGICIPS